MKYWKGFALHLCLLMLCDVFGCGSVGMTGSRVEGESQNVYSDIVKPRLQRGKQISLLLL